jgi:4-hydroxy-tetrahydrodipicolinate synthase
VVTAVRHYGRIEATGLTVLGVFGEAARLTAAERRTVVETVVAAGVQLPLVVGISALDPQLLAEHLRTTPGALPGG